MKIKKVSIENNIFFGTTEFNFTDAQGNILDNVVFAGENGCGKTQLLNIIYDFCNLSLVGDVTNEIRAFTIIFSEEELTDIIERIHGEITLVNPTGEFVITQDFTAQSNTWNRLKIKYSQMLENGSISDKEINSSWFFTAVDRYNLFRSIFSTVEINYTPKDSKNVTANEIDEPLNKSVRSSNDLATEIQQLLIDIQNNDANDLFAWVVEHPNEVPPDEIKSKRISRFKNAFSKVFQGLNYCRVANVENSKKVFFKKDDYEVEIGALSSGEKQIVFRGAFLLRNQESSKGCCILIDEPEISLHPIWQGKIFDYYRNLFVDSGNVQTSQLFIATHSQYVLKSALENANNTIILLLKNKSGSILCSHIGAPLVLPSITSAEINYFGFDLVSNDYHIELYTYLQSKIAHSNGKTECSVKECDTYITQQTKYDIAKHKKSSSHFNYNGHITSYETLPTYIRNAIDHPDSRRPFTQQELRTSIELLIELCK